MSCDIIWFVVWGDDIVEGWVYKGCGWGIAVDKKYECVIIDKEIEWVVF